MRRIQCTQPEPNPQCGDVSFRGCVSRDVEGLAVAKSVANASAARPLHEAPGQMAPFMCFLAPSRRRGVVSSR